MSDETTTVAASAPRAKRAMILTLITAVIVGGIGYGYYQLTSENRKLAQAISSLQATHAEQADTVTTLSSNLDELKTQAENQAQNTSSDVALLKAEAAGDKVRLALFEAQYLVNLANDEMQYANDSGMALVLLQRAQQVMSPLEGLDFSAIKQAIADNIAGLTASPTTNLTALYSTLNTLNANLDRMPLPLNPLKADNNAEEDKVNVDGLPWWKAQWRRTMHTLGKVVIVRYNGGNIPPLVLPEERVFIAQNLHAQMENVFWAVLNRNTGIYQAALLRMHGWIQQYYDTQSPITQSALQQLEQLSKESIAAPQVNIQATLAQFTQYFNSDVKTSS